MSYVINCTTSFTVTPLSINGGSEKRVESNLEFGPIIFDTDNNRKFSIGLIPSNTFNGVLQYHVSVCKYNEELNMEPVSFSFKDDIIDRFTSMNENLVIQREIRDFKYNRVCFKINEYVDTLLKLHVRVTYNGVDNILHTSIHMPEGKTEEKVDYDFEEEQDEGFDTFQKDFVPVMENIENINWMNSNLRVL